MGTDIHTIAQLNIPDFRHPERRKQWNTVAKNIAGEWRNYNCYAVLADVRNGAGFAGVRTGEGWEPISEPRGIPEGVMLAKKKHFSKEDQECSYSQMEDEEVVEEYAAVGRYFTETTQWLGDHSHSYVTLSEIKEALKKYEGAEYKNTGVVPLATYLKWKENGEKPESWSGGIGGPDIETYTEAEWESGVRSINKDAKIYIQMSWGVPAIRNLYWLTLVVRHLELIRDIEGRGDDLTDDDVRMVFGFDS